MAIFEKVYQASPIFLQNVMVSLAGYRKNKERYGKIYWEYRAFLTEFDKWDHEKQQVYQNEELVKFIQYSVRHSRFYRNLYADIAIDEITGIKDLAQLPIVDKEMLRQQMDEVVTISKKKAIIDKTGGTTGKSLVIYRTVDDMMRRMAMLDHFKARIGFENRVMRKATFNAKPIVPPRQVKKIFWRYNLAAKQMIYTPFRLTEANMMAYVNSLNRFKPQALDGYFTAMLDIAHFIERKNLKLTFKPIAIFPTSETLTSAGRATLERVFSCKVYDQYASSEGAPFVTECSHQVLHQELASGVFEHFEAGSHEVLVTSFTTHGTPLIRYRIGDSMVFASGEHSTCKCGLKAPVVQEIEGRKLDFLYTAQKAKVNAANVAGLFKELENTVIRAQLHQDQIDEIVILLETDQEKYHSQHEDKLKKEFHQRFGLDTKLLIRYVDEIPREASGKFRMIQNNIVD